MLLLSYGWFLIDSYSGVPDGPKDCLVRQLAAPAETPDGRVTSYPVWLSQQGGTVNDASCLNRTAVYGVARPTSEDEVRHALKFARDQGLAVSFSGTRHSMGGQATAAGGLIVDLRELNRIVVDETARTVRVGGGATWRQVLEAVHDHGLAVSAMPSIDILSVGGTISANAHGADFRVGSLAATIRSLRVMLADGTVRNVRSEHELFGAVVGGYGLFGVILEAELDLVPGEMYRLEQRTIRAADFAATYRRILADEQIRMMYAHVSTAPESFMDELVVYTHRRLEAAEPMPELRHEQDSGAARLLFNLARHGGAGQWIKWNLQRDLLPHVRQCHSSRNEALREAEACLVSRNQAMYNDLALLNNRLPQYTDILQEYFLPHDQLAPFLQRAAHTIGRHDAVLLNASIRVVHANPVLLDYARGERFSVVLYLSQDVSAAGNADMAGLTTRLIADAFEHDGSFYLPYQQHYTRADLARAYPRIEEFFALKRRYDPELLLSNSLYRRYAE